MLKRRSKCPGLGKVVEQGFLVYTALPGQLTAPYPVSGISPAATSNQKSRNEATPLPHHDTCLHEPYIFVA